MRRPLDIAIVRLRRSNVSVAAALGLLVVSVVWFLIAAPPVIAVAGVFAGVAAWCHWLERHPEATTPLVRGSDSGAPVAAPTSQPPTGEGA